MRKNIKLTLERKRPFGNPKHRWESSIKIDYKEVGHEGSVSNLVAGSFGRRNEAADTRKYRTIWTNIGFSRTLLHTIN
jgi:hypothetical protein